MGTEDVAANLADGVAFQDAEGGAGIAGAGSITNVAGHVQLLYGVRRWPILPRKRILVTGGAGFLGSHLCDRLVASDVEVICLDNFFTGSKRNVAHLLSSPSFEIVRHDVVEPILLEVDQIYNFACPASPIHYQYNPVKTLKTNVMGAINMLGLAKRVRARILQ